MVRDAYSAILAGGSLHAITKAVERRQCADPARQPVVGRHRAAAAHVMAQRRRRRLQGRTGRRRRLAGHRGPRRPRRGAGRPDPARAAHRRHRQWPQAPAERNRGVRQVRPDDGIGENRPTADRSTCASTASASPATWPAWTSSSPASWWPVSRDRMPRELLITDKRADINELRERPRRCGPARTRPQCCSPTARSPRHN